MLSIFVLLGHGPIILAAAPLTIGNNDLLMLTSHLLSFTDSFIFFVGCSLSVSKQPVSSLLPDPFFVFSISGRSGLYLDLKRLISPIHGLLARIQPESNVIKVLSAEFYFHKPITVHLELYLFYRFIHFLLYIGQY